MGQLGTIKKKKGERNACIYKRNTRDENDRIRSN